MVVNLNYPSLLYLSFLLKINNHYNKIFILIYLEYYPIQIRSCFMVNDYMKKIRRLLQENYLLVSKVFCKFFKIQKDKWRPPSLSELTLY